MNIHGKNREHLQVEVSGERKNTKLEKTFLQQLKHKLLIYFLSMATIASRLNLFYITYQWQQ